MELGFVICAQIFVFAVVSIVPMMVLRQNAAAARAPVVANPPARSGARIGH
jgi:hypothetical protein